MLCWKGSSACIHPEACQKGTVIMRFMGNKGSDVGCRWELPRQELDMCTKEQSGPTGAPANSLLPSQGRFTRGRVLVCRQASATAFNIKAGACVLIISNIPATSDVHHYPLNMIRSPPFQCCQESIWPVKAGYGLHSRVLKAGECLQQL